jgi:hypothetical protein
MYTDEMRRAFRSLECPKGFSLEVIDNDSFITVKAKEKVFMSLETVDLKRQAVEYMIRVKKALEDNGAIVLLVREGGKEI